MRAKDELIKLVLDNDFITAPRLRAEFRSLLDRVEIEAQAEFKNCNIPHVSDTVCPACYGAGVVPGDINGCYHCAGTGKQTGR